MIRIAANLGLRAFLWDIGNPGPSLRCEVILTRTWISFSHILGDVHNNQVTSVLAQSLFVHKFQNGLQKHIFCLNDMYFPQKFWILMDRHFKTWNHFAAENSIELKITALRCKEKLCFLPHSVLNVLKVHCAKIAGLVFVFWSFYQLG